MLYCYHVLLGLGYLWKLRLSQNKKVYNGSNLILFLFNGPIMTIPSKRPYYEPMKQCSIPHTCGQSYVFCTQVEDIVPPTVEKRGHKFKTSVHSQISLNRVR